MGQDGLHPVLRRERRPVRPRRPAATPKPGTPAEFVTKTSVTGEAGNGWPIGLGFRVPAIIVSPWTVGGWVSSELSDHTSQLRFLEKITGVREPNISDWRRRTVGDLTSAFRFHDTHKQAPVLPDTQGRYNRASTRPRTCRCRRCRPAASTCRTRSGASART
jgi:phospholipase C